MTIISLDGIRMEVNPPESNDEETRNPQSQILNPNQGMQDIVQPAELSEAMKELNDDTIDATTRMSKIDMRTRLHPFEINSILRVDTLVALKVLPTECLSLTRQKKRLNVSLHGLGRKENVDMAVGKREQDAKTAGIGGIVEKTKSFFGGGNKQQ